MPSPPDAPTSDSGAELPLDIELSRDGDEPLHRQIEQAMREYVVTGRWPARSRLPTEPILADRLGVNRGTLRRALVGLTREGLLTQIRGRGTFVAAGAMEPSIAQRFRTLAEDFRAQGFEFRTQVLGSRLERIPLAVQALLDADSSTPALRLERVLRGRRGPLAYVVNYVRADRCPGIEEIDFAQESLFETLEVRYGIPIARGRRTFSARRADREVARALETSVGEPVLYVEQVTYATGGRPIEYSDVWMDSTKVTITSMLERDPPPS